ncbi:transcriptional regulator [Pantoea ananatis]|uniref:ArsR/SmtB family transcription factor n=1 Tax=Pantoea TaxID=53335 RepID=UPI001EE4F7F8|nr:MULTISPECIES: winged helix-turn-helix domain-containing protein [Pantoea]MDC7870803.1 transcriptional regulator [Pantoea ananatis]MDI3415050.1 winged helix-turn-helix domain-containing protein [Pantoea sp. V106_11]PKC47651.1 ArsR family transcriptional regulator [Pantoea ananatis BRT98]
MDMRDRMKLIPSRHHQDNQPSLEISMSVVASAMADASRMHMLCALMDGRAWTATELSVVADIAPSTASGHLNKLLETGLLVCVVQGRHRYYSLSGREVASLLENLMGVSVRPDAPLKTTTPNRLRRARTCYDHLAGEIAVAIYDFLQLEGWICEDGTGLTPRGTANFANAGIALAPRSRRKACCPCLDWSERRFHAGGEVGAALLRFLLQKHWLVQAPGYRELVVTDSGKLVLQRLFNISLS